ncbi:hypothetical protein [Streptomyces sp. NPDC087212]|uniref:hypothetical protein n=1 Tax=Streptomyces sp. NPDC087212 TaxID=3365766 RepID=UPI0037F6680B
MSRFASLHPRVPDRSFINVLHAAASADAAASGQDVGLTLEALQTRRINAEAERQGRCRNCVALGEQNDSLTQQVEQLTQQVERLTQKDSEPCPACADHQRERAAYQQRQKEDSAHISRLQTELAELREKAAVEAGRQARWPRRQTSKTPLPVPRRPGDRQRTEKERAAALQLATQAASLHRLGNGDSATLLRHGTTEVLSPPETALVLVELRHQKQDDLADDLIHVYGRDQEYRDIMAVAAELHAEGAVHDAGAILRAALR